MMFPIWGETSQPDAPPNIRYALDIQVHTIPVTVLLHVMIMPSVSVSLVSKLAALRGIEPRQLLRQRSIIAVRSQSQLKSPFRDAVGLHHQHLVRMYKVSMNSDTQELPLSPIRNGSLAITTIAVHRLSGFVYPASPLKRLFKFLVDVEGFEPTLSSLYRRV